MRRALVTGSVAGLALAMVMAPPVVADSHDDGAHLSVLHGIPGLTVDVYVDGELLLDDFEPGTLAGPLPLPADTYTVAITADDAADDADPLLGPVDLVLEAGGDYTAVAHLQEDGEPTVRLYENDVSALARGEGRLTVRHTAAAPAVDVVVGGEVVVDGLANPGEATLDLPEGIVPATVVAAGTDDVVAGPVDVPVSAGILTVVYAWGSLEDDTFDLAVQLAVVGPVFLDVVPGQVFFDEIRWLAYSGLSEGTLVDGDRYFLPSRGLSRQAMAAFLYRYAGTDWTPEDGAAPTFPDVPADHPFHTEVEWMVATGLATGYTDGTFRPSTRISRQAMAAFTYRWGVTEGWTPSAEQGFSDVGADHPFFTEIQWTFELGVATGYDDGTFRSSTRVSRQATAAFLYRFDERGLGAA